MLLLLVLLGEEEGAVEEEEEAGEVRMQGIGRVPTQHAATSILHSASNAIAAEKQNHRPCSLRTLGSRVTCPLQGMVDQQEQGEDKAEEEQEEQEELLQVVAIGYAQI